MKSFACKTAVMSTIVGFLLTTHFAMHPQGTEMTARVLEQVKYVPTVLPQGNDMVLYDASSTEPVLVENTHFFPEIEDTPRALDSSVVDTPQCPFAPGSGDVVIDFTRNGFLPLSEVYLYANKDAEDAQKTAEIEVPIGTYVVQLASYNGGEEVKENNYEQQWYLKLYDEAGNIVHTTQSTRDMYIGESGTIELVEQGMVLDAIVTHVRAVHEAFPDKEPQTIAPLCVLLSQEEVQMEGNTSRIELQSDDKNLFSASVFLQHNDTMQKEYHFILALSLILTLLSVVGTFIWSSISGNK